MDVLKPSVKWISQNDSQAEKEVVAVGFFVNIVQLKDLYDAFRKTLAYLAGYRENMGIFEQFFKEHRRLLQNVFKIIKGRAR